MLSSNGTRARLLGTIFAAGILLAPNALAQGGAPHSYRSAWRHEIAYGERTSHRARMIHTSYMRHVHQAAKRLRREHAYADAREKPITAELNLVQLQGGRERAAKLAQWQLQYGGAASTPG